MYHLINVIENNLDSIPAGVRSKPSFKEVLDIDAGSTEDLLSFLNAKVQNKTEKTCSYCLNDTISIDAGGNYICSTCKRSSKNLVFTKFTKENIYIYSNQKFNPMTWLNLPFYKLIQTKDALKQDATIPTERETLSGVPQVRYIVIKPDIELLLSKYKPDSANSVMSYLFPIEQEPQEAPQDEPHPEPQEEGRVFIIQNIIGNNGDDIDSPDCKVSDIITLSTVNRIDITSELNERPLEYISIKLLKKLLDGKYKLNNKVCMFCFNDTLEIKPDPNRSDIVTCSVCRRCYHDDYTRVKGVLDYLPAVSELHTAFIFPSIDSLYLYQGESPFDTIIGKKYSDINNTDKNKLQLWFSSGGSPLNPELPIKVLFYEDIRLFLQRIDLSDFIHHIWTELPKRINGKQRRRDAKMSIITYDKFGLKSIDTIMSEIKEPEFSGTSPIITFGYSVELLPLTKIKKKDIIDLTNVFHLLFLSEDIPYISMIANNQQIRRVYKETPTDLISLWNNIQSDLVIKVKTPIGYTTILITTRKNIRINIQANESESSIRDIVNKVIRDVNKLLDDHEELEEFPEVENWGYPGSNTLYHNLNAQVSFEFDNYKVSDISDAFGYFNEIVLVNYHTEKSVYMNFIRHLADNSIIQYNSFFNGYFKRYVTEPTNPSGIIARFETLEKVFIEKFGEENIDILNKWAEENDEILKRIWQEGSAFLRGFKLPIESPVIIISVVFGRYTIDIKNIPYNNTFYNDIFSIIKKILYIFKNPTDEHKIICPVIPLKISKFVDMNPRAALNTNFPNRYWSASNKPPYTSGFAKDGCQAQHQPLMFDSETMYRQWVSDQAKTTNQTIWERLFTTDCPSLTDDEIVRQLQILDKPEGVNRQLNCVNMQIEILNSIAKLGSDELVEISKVLGLPSNGSKIKLISNIQLLLNIRKFSILQGSKNVYPSPDTFVLSQNNKDYYFVCPNNHPSGTNNKYIGFIPLESNPAYKNSPDNKKVTFCAPCCKQSIDSDRIEFCSGLINHEEYVNKKNTQGVQYILGYSADVLQFGRFANLAPTLSSLMNGVTVIPVLQKNFSEKYYVKYGVLNNDFIGCIEELTGINSLDSKMYRAITKEVFMSLGDSTVAWLVDNDIDEFKSRILQNDLELDVYWELLQLPGVLAKEGVNILIIKNTVDRDAEIRCPKYADINHFYSESKSTIILIQDQSGIHFNPMVLLSSNTENRAEHKWVGIFDNLGPIFDIYKKWAEGSCQTITNYTELSARSLIKNYRSIIEFQFVDVFGKVKYLATKTEHLLPCIRSGIDPTVPIKLVNPANILEFKTTYKQTEEYLKRFPQYSKFNMQHDNAFLSITELGIMVPVIGKNPTTKRDIMGSLVTVDTLLVKGTFAAGNDVFSIIKKQQYVEESYDTFKYLFSRFIKNKEETNVFILLQTFMTTVNTINTPPDLTGFVQGNIRGQSKFHVIAGKFSVLEELLPEFGKRISRELRYPILAKDILQQLIPQIKDKGLYQSIDDRTTYL